MPKGTPAAAEDQILAVRRTQTLGPDPIGAQLAAPGRAVSRVLARHGVPPLRACDPMAREVIRASKATAVRQERDRSAEQVHMDVKKLGRIPHGGGRRAHDGVVAAKP
jgi:hypothetical protein